MKYVKHAISAALLAAAAFATHTAGAFEPGFVSCSVVDRNDDMLVIEAVVDPMLDHAPATVRFVPAPDFSLPCGASVLRVGANLIAVPNFHVPGTYVVEANGRAKGCEDDTLGAQ